MSEPLTKTQLTDMLKTWELRLKLHLGAMMLAALVATALICRLM